MPKYSLIHSLMQHAYQEACFAKRHHDVPVGCSLYHYPSQRYFNSHNTCYKDHQALHHAEYNVIQDMQVYCKESSLQDMMRHSVLFVTLEPCAMCTALLERLHLSMLYFGAYNPFDGHVVHGGRLFTQKYVGGILENTFSDLLQDFFVDLRMGKHILQ